MALIHARFPFGFHPAWTCNANRTDAANTFAITPSFSRSPSSGAHCASTSRRTLVAPPHTRPRSPVLGGARFLCPCPFIPVVDGFFRIGIGLFAFLISFGFSLVTIAIAWLFYRPLLGILLLSLAALAFAGLIAAAITIGRKRLGKKEEEEPEPEPA